MWWLFYEKHLFQSSVRSFIQTMFGWRCTDTVECNPVKNISAHILGLSLWRCLKKIRRQRSLLLSLCWCRCKNLFRQNMFFAGNVAWRHKTDTHTHTYTCCNEKTECVTRADIKWREGTEQVRKWIDNLFTVLRRYASHRVFYHRFEVISQVGKTLFFLLLRLSLHNDDTTYKNTEQGMNDGHILREFSSLLAFLSK